MIVERRVGEEGPPFIFTKSLGVTNRVLGSESLAPAGWAGPTHRSRRQRPRRAGVVERHPGLCRVPTPPRPASHNVRWHMDCASPSLTTMLLPTKKALSRALPEDSPEPQRRGGGNAGRSALWEL